MDEIDSRLADLAGRVTSGETVTSPDVSGMGHDRFVRMSLGLVIDLVADGRVDGHLEAGPHLWQNAGIVHGGVWCAVVETLASWGAALRVTGRGRRVVGVSNRTDFVRPHQRGRVDARAVLVDEVAQQQLWDVVVSRATDGAVVARGTVRLQELAADGAGPAATGT
jgi:uncharacterized protein (TIGR00369 family)